MGLARGPAARRGRARRRTVGAEPRASGSDSPASPWDPPPPPAPMQALRSRGYTGGAGAELAPGIPPPNPPCLESLTIL